MTKAEIQNKIDEVDMEIRSLMDSVKDTSKEINLDEVRTKKTEFEEKRAKLIKELAQADMPAEKGEKRMAFGMDIEELRKALREKRTVNLSGTGVINTIRDIVLKAQKDDAILQRVAYYYGANSSTIIPIFPNNVSFAFVSEGGSVTADGAKLGNSTVVPKEAMASLPVSDYVLDLSAAEFEAKLEEIFANGLRDLMRSQVLTGDGTNAQGIFTDAEITTKDYALTVANLGAFAASLNEIKYNNKVIIMSATVYGAFLADTATDETTKIYKEDLIRNKRIEGIEVLITPDAPTSITSGSIAVVGGSLDNYGLGVAGQLVVTPKDTAGASYKTFDAKAYFSGKPIISSDFVGFKIA